MDKRSIDSLSVVSFNGMCRKGRKYLDFSSQLIGNVVGTDKPDLMFLPGQNTDIPTTILNEYKQERVKHNNATVLLYDAKRLQLEAVNWINSPHPTIHSYEEDKLAFPIVNVVSPKPASNVIKSFHCISWHSELLQDIENPKQYAWRFLGLAQHLAWISGSEVLIGGDFNLTFKSLKQLVKQHNKIVEKSIDDIKPFFREIGYMDSMTEYINRPQRRLRQLTLHKCNVDPITQETEYFVASKEMKLFDTKLSSAQYPVVRGQKQDWSSTKSYHHEQCAANNTKEQNWSSTTGYHPEKCAVNNKKEQNWSSTTSHHPEQCVVNNKKEHDWSSTTSHHPEQCLVNNKKEHDWSSTTSHHPEQCVVNNKKEQDWSSTTSHHPEQCVVNNTKESIKPLNSTRPAVTKMYLTPTPPRHGGG